MLDVVAIHACCSKDSLSRHHHSDDLWVGRAVNIQKLCKANQDEHVAPRTLPVSLDTTPGRTVMRLRRSLASTAHSKKARKRGTGSQAMTLIMLHATNQGFNHQGVSVTTDLHPMLAAYKE